MQTIYEVGEIPWKPFSGPKISNMTYFASKEDAYRIAGIGIHYRGIKEITVFTTFAEYQRCERDAKIKARAIAKLDAVERKVLGL